ncbi:twin-arginine translocation signal domain-containing protein [Micromonospora wenchangensis]|uniref:twin-arginine translocation signal domain-containing protein n=1 Tax=Micromonospora wenchangensis TaxID=1185415 RepID=UPI00343F28FC
MAISRRALVKAVAASGALAAATVAGLPGVAWAANTAYATVYFIETPSFQGANYGPVRSRAGRCCHGRRESCRPRIVPG